MRIIWEALKKATDASTPLAENLHLIGLGWGRGLSGVFCLRFIYLFERQSTHEWEGQKERERISSRHHAEHGA